MYLNDLTERLPVAARYLKRIVETWTEDFTIRGFEEDQLSSPLFLAICDRIMDAEPMPVPALSQAADLVTAGRIFLEYHSPDRMRSVLRGEHGSDETKDHVSNVTPKPTLIAAAPIVHPNDPFVNPIGRTSYTGTRVVDQVRSY